MGVGLGLELVMPTCRVCMMASRPTAFMSGCEVSGCRVGRSVAVVMRPGWSLPATVRATRKPPCSRLEASRSAWLGVGARVRGRC